MYPFKEPPRKVDSVRRTEEEYYNKKDLLPKLTKPQDQVEGEKKVKYIEKTDFRVNACPRIYIPNFRGNNGGWSELKVK